MVFPHCLSHTAICSPELLCKLWSRQWSLGIRVGYHQQQLQQQQQQQSLQHSHLLTMHFLLHLGSLHIYFTALSKAVIWWGGVIRVTHQSIPQCTQASCETLWVRAAAGRRVVTLVGLSLGGGLPKKIKKDSWPVKTLDAVTCSELCGRVSRVSSLRATIFVRALLSNGYRYKEGYSR